MVEEISNSKSTEDNASVTINNVVEKVSALAAIAIEYDYLDEKEFEENVSQDLSNIVENKNNEEQQTNEQPEIIIDYDKGAYRLSKENEERDSESDSESSSSGSSILSISTDSDSSSESESNEARRHKRNPQQEQRNKVEFKSELDNLPPIEELTISVPEVLCDPLGEVAWMVEQLVIVRPKPDKPTLNLDTVLFVYKGQQTLGKVFDVFGHVNDPHYCVRFNSSEHIQEKEIKVGMTVYYCPNSEYTSLVFSHELIKIKGTDSPGDGEPPDFSDDEEERKYYENLEKSKQNNAEDRTVPTKRRRTSVPKSGWQSNHPWNRNAKSQNQRGPNSYIHNPYHSHYNNPWYYSSNSWQMRPKNPQLNSLHMNLNDWNNYYRFQNNDQSANDSQLLNSEIPCGMPPTFYQPFPHSSYQSYSSYQLYRNVYPQSESVYPNCVMPQTSSSSSSSLPPLPSPPPLPLVKEESSLQDKM